MYFPNFYEDAFSSDIIYALLRVINNINEDHVKIPFSKRHAFCKCKLHVI